MIVLAVSMRVASMDRMKADHRSIGADCDEWFVSHNE